MVYQRVEIDNTVQDFFAKVEPQIRNRAEKLKEQPRLKEAYVDHLSPQESRYVFKFKAGRLGSQRKFVVSLVSKEGSMEIVSLHEGHKTFF